MFDPALRSCCCYTARPQVSDSFPFKWINKKWKEGFYVTSMATSHTRWAVVMSRNAGFVDQVGSGWGVDAFSVGLARDEGHMWSFY